MRILPKLLFVGWLGLVLMFCFCVAKAVQAYKEPPRQTTEQELRGALADTRQRLFRLEERVKALEARNPAGEIRVYKVDTAAGTIECRSCRFAEEK